MKQMHSAYNASKNMTTITVILNSLYTGSLARSLATSYIYVLYLENLFSILEVSLDPEFWVTRGSH